MTQPRLILSSPSVGCFYNISSQILQSNIQIQYSWFGVTISRLSQLAALPLYTPLYYSLQARSASVLRKFFLGSQVGFLKPTYLIRTWLPLPRFLVPRILLNSHLTFINAADQALLSVQEKKGFSLGVKAIFIIGPSFESYNLANKLDS